MKPLRSRTERLPEAELDLLAELRRAGEASAADLRRGIARRRPMAHGSVLTLLGRLEAKGLVTRRKGESGKAYLYTATARAEQAIRNLVTRWIDRLYARDRTAFVATLLVSRHGSGAVAVYVIACCALTAVATWLAPETRHTALDAPPAAA